VARHLASHYGSVAFDVTRLIRDDPSLRQRIHPGGPDIWAQVVHARDHEWAVTVDDVTRRRTTLAIRGLDTPEIRDSIKTLLD